MSDCRPQHLRYVIRPHADEAVLRHTESKSVDKTTVSRVCSQCLHCDCGSFWQVASLSSLDGALLFPSIPHVPQKAMGPLVQYMSTTQAMRQSHSIGLPINDRVRSLACLARMHLLRVARWLFSTYR